mmetsp:Transcript_3959/g.7638  ORF Transcript_3959/g.7638 Transcript_3959/m.7638 type:complete len:536 (-) Transcript_3959:883-2490(-)
MQAFPSDERCFPRRAITNPDALEFLMDSHSDIPTTLGATTDAIHRVVHDVMDRALVLGWSPRPKGSAFRSARDSLWNALGIIEGLNLEEPSGDLSIVNVGLSDPSCTFEYILFPELYLDTAQRVVGGTLMFANNITSTVEQILTGRFVVNLDEPQEIALRLLTDRILSLSLSSEGIEGQRHWICFPRHKNLKTLQWPSRVLAELVYQPDCISCRAQNWPCTCTSSTTWLAQSPWNYSRLNTWGEFRDLVHSFGRVDSRVSLYYLSPSRLPQFIGASLDTFWHGGREHAVTRRIKDSYKASRILRSELDHSFPFLGTPQLPQGLGRSGIGDSSTEAGTYRAEKSEEQDTFLSVDNEALVENSGVQHRVASPISFSFQDETFLQPELMNETSLQAFNTNETPPVALGEEVAETEKTLQFLTQDDISQQNPQQKEGSLSHSPIQVDRPGNRIPYSCSSCSRSFSRPGRLEQHIAVVHEGLVLFPCPHCTSSFASAGNLNRHVRAVHLRMQRYFCSICSQGYFSKTDLDDHLSRLHHVI